MVRLAQVLVVSIDVLLAAWSVEGVGADREQLAHFEKIIRPLLDQHCYKCHSQQANEVEGELLLDSKAGWQLGGSRGPAVVPGKPDQSLLIEAVRYKNADLQMPPDGKLADNQIAALVEWVKLGALDPRTGAGALRPQKKIDFVAGRKFWAFVAPRRQVLPPVEQQAWPSQPLDAFVLAKLEQQQLSPSPGADRRTLVRRVTFDLTGLPPTPQEVLAFLADARPDAYDLLVDRLLASPHLGEKWARHWMDVARYGSDQAENPDAKKYDEAWRYRDWLIRAINRDVPYDRFVQLQLAADAMSDAHHEDLPALGFVALGPQYIGTSSDTPIVTLRLRAAEWEDRVDVVTRGFLGLTAACARCHDHKFDPIAMEDYYALAGVFANSRFVQLALLSGEQRNQWERLRDKRNALRQRRDELQAKSNLQSDELAKATVAEAKSVDVQRGKVERQMDKIRGNAGWAHGVADVSRPRDLHVFRRGDPANQGPRVPRRFLEILSQQNPVQFTTGSGRLSLARAIVSRENPLTARVMVNRLWAHLFGRGLVDSPSNFGQTGSRPSHPRMLDDLAVRMMEYGWSRKKMIREMVLSATYRQSSQFDQAKFDRDSGNRYLWRQSRRRLTVEAWRDAVLAVSGELQLRMGGGSEGEVGEHDSRQGYRGADRVEHRRRTVYSRISRYRTDSMLRLFDFPDPNNSVGQRVQTVTPIQQLFIMNSAFMKHHATRLAQRLGEDPQFDLIEDSNQQRPSTGEKPRIPANSTARIVRAYELLFARHPTSAELTAAGEYFDNPSADPSKQWTQFAHALLMSSEMQYLD